MMEPEVKIITPRSESTEMQWVRRLSRLLDTQFVIPGANIRFGLDPLFSLIPVLGDLITYAISGLLIYTMSKHGASRKVVILMIMNATVDALIGAVPLVGTIADIFFRSNTKNLKLLEEHYGEGKHQGSGRGILAIIALAAVVIVVISVYVVYKVGELIISAF